MGMEVDYEAFKADKRSREPTRMQTAARKVAINKWIAQALADNIIKPYQQNDQIVIILKTHRNQNMLNSVLVYLTTNKLVKVYQRKTLEVERGSVTPL